MSLDTRLHKLAKGMEGMLPRDSGLATEEHEGVEERWTLSVLKELVTIANRGKGVILQHEDPVQACYSCLEDLQDLQKTLAQNHLGPGVWPHAFLETFGARIEQILREKHRALQDWEGFFVPTDTDLGLADTTPPKEVRRGLNFQSETPEGDPKLVPLSGIPPLTLPPTRSKPPHPPDFNRSQSSKSPRVGQSSPGSSPQTPRAQSFPSSPPAFGPFQGSSLKSLSQKGSPLSLSRDPSPTRSSPVSKGSKTPSETSDGNPQSPYGSPSQPPISNPLRWARRNSPPGVSIKSNEEGVGLQLKRIDGGWPVEQQSNPPARHDREGGYAQGPVPQNPPKWLRNRQSSDTSQPKTSPRNVPGSVVDKPSHDSQPKAEKLSPPEYNSTNTSSPGYNSANTSTSQPTGEQARNIEASTVREQVALETASSLRTAPGVTKSQPVDTNARAEKVSYNEDHQASKDASSGEKLTPPQWEHDVFISHAGENKTFAAHLHSTFERLKLRPFLDEADLHPGDAANQRIFGALCEAPVGLVILGETFFTKKWPMDELREIVARHTLLPVLYKLDYERAEQLLAQYSEAAAMDPSTWSTFANHVLRTTMVVNPFTLKSEAPFLQFIAFCVLRKLVKYTCPSLVASCENKLLADKVLKRIKKACQTMANEFIELQVKQINEAEEWAQYLQGLRSSL